MCYTITTTSGDPPRGSEDGDLMEEQKVINRANSDGLSIEMVVNDRNIPAVERMALIEEIVDDWKRAVGDSPKVKKLRAKSSILAYWKGRV